MNYVILNGVNSRGIKGLLIQELPPVSKPMIRIEREEIDGRDGDVVIKLGYSAYDREMTIGLYGDYDVDEVISFFNTSGKAIFSNEPDKYYNYEIYEQIDFERLVRWKQAKVIFHVQPFKFSTVDDSVSARKTFLTVPEMDETINGVRVTVTDEIRLYGSPTANTQFYIPVTDCTLDKGEYTLTVGALGAGKEDLLFRLIESMPIDAETFGGEVVTLEPNSQTIDATLTARKKYGYVWIFAPQGSHLNCGVTASIVRNNQTSLTVRNRGNVISKPSVTIFGTGTVTLSLNGNSLFTITMGNHDYVTIDPVQMNAYCGTELMNRSVVGDYENLKFPMGLNTISWTGNVTAVELKDYSRWL